MTECGRAGSELRRNLLPLFMFIDVLRSLRADKVLLCMDVCSISVIIILCVYCYDGNEKGKEQF